MKILRITLQNIASLAGQHTVDFTQEPLKSAGLFSISGATGAGKSSLLDALCLALFNRTPRIHNVKSSLARLPGEETQHDPRSLLRRGCVSGLAEVAFIGVDDKPYTARWSVRRARKSETGKLQNVDRVLFHGHIDPVGEGDQLTAGKKSEVAEMIQQKLGLTFEQFTRAVLLAQNEFASFLKSDDRNRGDILEKLTGTERFRNISIAAFERAREQKEKISTLEAQRQGPKGLPDEQRTELDARLKQSESDRTENQKALQQREEQQRWYAELKEHKTAVTTATNAKEAAEAQWKDSQPLQNKIRITVQVVRHGAPLKNRQTEIATDLAACRTKLTELQPAVEAALQTKATQQAAQTLAQQTLTAFKERLQEQQPLLKEATQLDERIALLTGDVQSKVKIRKDAKTAFDKVNGRFEAVNKSIASLTRKTDQLQKKCDSLKAYAPFCEDASLWSDRIEQASELKVREQKLQKEVQQQKDASKDLQAEVDQLTEQIQSLENQIQQHQAASEQARQQLKELNPEQFAQQYSELDSRREAFRRLIDVSQKRSALSVDLAECEQQIALLQQQIQKAQQVHGRLNESDIPKARIIAEQSDRSVRQVKSALSDHAVQLRTELTDGQACVVCGSTQHPYSDQPPSDEILAIRTLEDEAARTKQQLENLVKQESELNGQIKTQTQTLTTQQQHASRLKQQQTKLTLPDDLPPELKLFLNLPDDKRIHDAEVGLKQLDQQLQRMADQQKQAEALRKSIEESAGHLHKSNEDFQQKRDARTAAETKLSKIQTQRQADEKQLHERQAELQNHLLPLQQIFAAQPTARTEFENDTSQFHNNFVQQLHQLKQDRLKLEQLKLDQQAENRQLKELTDQRNSEEQRTQEALQEEQKVQQQLDQAKAERQRLFEGRSIEEVQQRFNQEQQTAETALKTAAQALESGRSHVVQAQQQVDSTQQHISDLEEKLQNATERLLQWKAEFCKEQDFDLDDSTFQQMLQRSDDWIDQQRRYLEDLQKSVQEKRGREQECLARLDQWQKQQPTELSEEALADFVSDLRSKQQDLDQQVKDLNKQVTLDDEARRRDHKLIADLQKAHQDAEHWLKLDDLIGSKDGNKFKLIAQRHTLDILLKYTNQQLKMLSGRYRLERMGKSLNLMVIDQEMADERRSVHSLSGGETFLASLALALGLASLTSNRLKIESLFIDEGFGSLDKDTLDVAMNALMRLEAQGRKVGVISHVSEMTDAIPVTIQVVKGANGASKIECPEF